MYRNEDNCEKKMRLNDLVLEQKRQLSGILEIACQNLEITKTQFEDAESKYNTVAKWLNGSDSASLSQAIIFPQGSIKLETTVKPIGQDEFDVDLMCHIPNFANVNPADLRNLIGNRLKENELYKKNIEPLNRGWRINFKNDFHLDITPAIDNVNSINGSLLVPDRLLHSYKESNPKGYANWFSPIAEKQPTYSTLFQESSVKADAEPMPEQRRLKGVLRRSIQLMKRHRDLYYLKKSDFDKKNAPISIIITTLATQAYESLVMSVNYDNDIDLMTDIVKSMPNYIDIEINAGIKNYYIENPSENGENFAEKWNKYPERAENFYDWHNAAQDNLTSLISSGGKGLQYINEEMESIFGDSITKKTFSQYTEIMNTNRATGNISVGTTGTIGAVTAVATNKAVAKNTFYGK